jgi:hypothetical protein
MPTRQRLEANPQFLPLAGMSLIIGLLLEWNISDPNWSRTRGIDLRQLVSLFLEVKSQHWSQVNWFNGVGVAGFLLRRCLSIFCVGGHGLILWHNDAGNVPDSSKGWVILGSTTRRTQMRKLQVWWCLDPVPKSSSASCLVLR